MDFQKLADRLGYKNVRSASDSYYRFKRGIDPSSSSHSSSGVGKRQGRIGNKRSSKDKGRKVVDDEEGEEGGDSGDCEVKAEDDLEEMEFREGREGEGEGYSSDEVTEIKAEDEEDDFNGRGSRIAAGMSFLDIMAGGGAFGSVKQEGDTKAEPREDECWVWKW